MKQLFTYTIILLFSTSIWAQSPKKISYQAVVRNHQNVLITNSQVGIKISILKGNYVYPVYTETHAPATDGNGVINIEIGTGLTSGDFSDINWAKDGPFFIRTEIDPNGGSNYTISGTSQLLSVPFALHAQTAHKAKKAKYAKTAGHAVTADRLTGGGTGASSETLLFPQSARTGKYLTVSFSGAQDVVFTEATPVALTFQQGSAIYPQSVHRVNDRKLDAEFYIPYQAATGTYDVILNPISANPITLKESFNIYW